jgi:hypothetical protein
MNKRESYHRSLTLPVIYRKPPSLQGVISYFGTRLGKRQSNEIDDASKTTLANLRKPVIIYKHSIWLTK